MLTVPKPSVRRFWPRRSTSSSKQQQQQQQKLGDALSSSFKSTDSSHSDSGSGRARGSGATSSWKDNGSSSTTFTATTSNASDDTMAVLSVEHIRDTALAFWPSRVLTAAVEMGLFTELSVASTGTTGKGGMGMTHSEIVQLLCLHEDLRPDFLDTLVSFNMLARSGKEAAAIYSNTAEADLYLVKHHHESYIGDTLIACGTSLYQQYASYPESLKTEKVKCPSPQEMMKRVNDIERRFNSHSAVTPRRILDIAIGFVRARVLHAAVDLDVFAAIATYGGTSSKQLSAEHMCQILKIGQACGALERRMVDFLDALVEYHLLHVQVGALDAKRYYCNTAETAYFLVASSLSLTGTAQVPSPHPHSRYYGNFIKMASARIFHFWADLPDALTTGLNQNETIRKKTFDDLYKCADRLDLFMGGMVSFSAECRHAFAEAFDWGPYTTLVDVGGGAGHLACTAAMVNPHLVSCITTDLPPVERIVQQCIKDEFGMTNTNRVRFLGHNYLTDDIPCADVIVMGIILQDVSLPVKKMLIAKAFAALPEDGVLVIMDCMIDDNRNSNTYALCMSLHMLIEFGVDGGFNYTGADVTAWCLEAGFGRVEIQPLGDTSYSMALAYKM